MQLVPSFAPSLADQALTETRRLRGTDRARKRVDCCCSTSAARWRTSPPPPLLLLLLLLLLLVDRPTRARVQPADIQLLVMSPERQYKNTFAMRVTTSAMPQLLHSLVIRSC